MEEPRKSASVEERIWKGFWDSNFGQSLTYFPPAVYGAIASTFRIPTTIRKLADENSLIDKMEVNGAPIIGVLVGGAVGYVAEGVAIYLAVREAYNNNPTPALLLAGAMILTNVASGGYENFRKQKRIKEEREKSD